MECCDCIGNGKTTSFRTNSSLQAHIASAQSKPNLYMCDSCLKPIVSEHGLLKHSQNSCGKGFRTAELDARIAGKLELYQFMEKSVNVSLNKKFGQEQHLLSPNKKSKVVSIRGNAEPVLDTQLQEEHPGSSNEQSAENVVSSGNRPPSLRSTQAENEILFQRNQSSTRSVQAENEILLRGIRESWRTPQGASIYTPGMITPGMIEHRSMYMETRMREPSLSGYHPDSRFGEPLTSQFQSSDRMGGKGLYFLDHWIFNSLFRKSGTTIISVFAIFDEDKYLITFGDKLMTTTRGEPVALTAEDYKKFFLKCTQRSIGEATKRHDALKARKDKEKAAQKAIDDKVLNKVKSGVQAGVKGVKGLGEKAKRMCKRPDIDEEGEGSGTTVSSEPKLYKYWIDPKDRDIARIFCAVGMAGTQFDTEMHRLKSIPIIFPNETPTTRTPGNVLGERLFPSPYNKQNTALLVSSRTDDNVLKLELVYVCRCEEAGEHATCPHVVAKPKELRTKQNFVCEEVTSWMESIGSGADLAKTIMYARFKESLTADGLAVRGVSKEELLDFVRNKVYKEVSEFDPATGNETQVVLLCSNPQKNELIDFKDDE